MSKTPFSKKCEILGDLWINYKDRVRDLDGWWEFFDYADVGLPLSWMVSNGHATAEDSGKDFIDAAWYYFCQTIGIDPDGKYETLSDAWSASPQPTIDLADA